MMLSIFKLGAYEASQIDLSSWLSREQDPEFVLLEDEKLARFLNGLIIKNRGAKSAQAPTPEAFLNNNMVLQKLKIALNLQAEKLLALLEEKNVTLSKHELSALFRRAEHKHYRPCSDELLGNFLDAIKSHQ